MPAPPDRRNSPWRSRRAASDDSNNYLTQLVEQARVDGGVTLPLVGSASLAEARQAVNSGVRNIGRLARQALAAGNLDGAEKLIGEALRQDPNDTEAGVAEERVGEAEARRRSAGAARGRRAARRGKAVPPPRTPPLPAAPAI